MTTQDDQANRRNVSENVGGKSGPMIVGDGNTMTQDDHSVTVGGSVSGTGIAIGNQARADVTINQQSAEILKLLDQLHQEIQRANLPEPQKEVLARAIPDMQQAAQSENPKPGVTAGLNRLNDNLQLVGAAAGNVSGIVKTIAEIATAAGVAIHVAAPFIATLL